MKRSHKKVRIGILGCGAIGSRLAKACRKEFKNICELTALYDTDHEKTIKLAKTLGNVKLVQKSISQLLSNCDLLVEATNAANPRPIIRQALAKQKNVLVMSVGKILNSPELLTLAKKNRCRLLIPSGAIAGMDAIKAARLARISHVTLTTRKPVSGFIGVPYVQNRGIDLDQLTGETVIFEGNVAEAVKHFPQNINVAAVLALASGAKDKLKIRIITSPKYKTNTHEIEVAGDFGRIMTRTENTVCPDNPKTSYLAVLSALETLQNFCMEADAGI